MIEITDLYKYYGERRAVGPLSCSIAQGEVVGLLGLNGAGKTTTLRILACDLLPSSGTVKVDGLDVVDNPHEVRARIGYLPDHPPLYPEMSVREYLIFAAKLRGMSDSAANKRLPEVLALTELGKVADDPIASLSHGFKQRVGIAQAIVHEPRLLVLDEPITGLDPVQIVEMRELVRSLKGKHTILLSSHILSEISETCDRILVLRDGAIGAAGTEAELTGKLLRGSRVDVVVRGNASAARDAVESAEGVTKIADLEHDEATKGSGVIALRVEADRDARAAIARAVIEAKLDLLAIGPSQDELENVFISLAGGTRAARAAVALSEASDDADSDVEREDA